MESETAYEEKIYLIFNSNRIPYDDEIFERVGFPQILKSNTQPIDYFPHYEKIANNLA